MDPVINIVMYLIIYDYYKVIKADNICKYAINKTSPAAATTPNLANPFPPPSSTILFQIS